MNMIRQIRRRVESSVNLMEIVRLQKQVDGVFPLAWGLSLMT